VRKQELRAKVLDRMPTRYSRGVVTVLVKIIDLTSVENWKTSDVEYFYSKPKTDMELAFLTNLARYTVHRAIKTLLHDGIIKPSTQERNSYSINPDEVLRIPSSYVARRTKELEEKIHNAVRMRFARWNGLTGRFWEWGKTHPAKCACSGLFCSHPSTI
jgi:hypothetical protein